MLEFVVWFLVGYALTRLIVRLVNDSNESRMVKQLNGNISQVSDVELLILSKKLTELKDKVYDGV